MRPEQNDDILQMTIWNNFLELKLLDFYQNFIENAELIIKFLEITFTRKLMFTIYYTYLCIV